MLQPGFAVIHSNELETLRDLLVSWMKENPLSPLESEDILVQSNGIAQWLKMALAETGDKGMGIAAGLRVELPNQFIWRLYRAVLGNEVPVSLPYDKPNLRWRLLRMLPTLGSNSDFEPITRYLADDHDGRDRKSTRLNSSHVRISYAVCLLVLLSFPTRRSSDLGLRVELPNQFIWRLYRAVLGNEVPVSLPYDKPNLRWRLLRMLPTLGSNSDFEPITRYLADDHDG